MSRSLRAAIGASTLALAAMPGVALAKGSDGSSQPRGTNTPAAVIQRSGRRHPERNQKRIRRHQRRPAIQAGHRRAHLLVPGTGYHQGAGSTRVRSLQRRLAHLGFTPGPIDGRYGPLTTGSVQRFQAAASLAVDGIAGPHTLAALKATRHAVMAPGAGYRQPAGWPRALAAAATGPPGLHPRTHRRTLWPVDDLGGEPIPARPPPARQPGRRPSNASGTAPHARSPSAAAGARNEPA